MKYFLKKFIPVFLIDKYHYLQTFLGAFWYRFPSRKIKVIGITGTNGKSTTINLIIRILEEAGFKVASASSIKFKIQNKNWPNKLRMTMMGGFQLQKFLRQAIDADCEYAVLEITSEGIKQYRHKFINFELAGITNLTPEHIEAHKGFENYKKAKGKLFQAVKNIHIVNLDDEHVDYFLGFSAKKKYGYGLENPKFQFSSSNEIPNLNFQKIVAQNFQTSSNGVTFFVNNIEFNLELLGQFNVYNALLAICIGLSQGIDLKTCQKALEKAERIPGRMETVISKPFRIIVDYAFTPNALEQVYQTLTAKPGLVGKMICVLGSCGGGRDKWKRPVLGEIAAKYCDKIIITNEDPYDENPMEIINQVFKGTKGKAFKILKRREAIKKALNLANSGDLVIITGKGCEPSICLAKGKQIPWDDRKVVREEFNLLKK